MERDYGHYQEWESGDLDLVAVAAHAAAELDALNRGVKAEPEALTILSKFLASLGGASTDTPRCAGPVLTHQLAMAINEAVQTTYQPPQTARRVADVVREAARVALDLASAASTSPPSEAELRERVRHFCLELSRAAMTPVPMGSEEHRDELQP